VSSLSTCVTDRYQDVRDTPPSVGEDQRDGTAVSGGLGCAGRIDGHRRRGVIAAVVPKATGRAVCLALVAALREYGIPEEPLTDNGKQTAIDEFRHRYNTDRPHQSLAMAVPADRFRPARRRHRLEAAAIAGHRGRGSRHHLPRL
jgi:transposase InsO family protein